MINSNSLNEGNSHSESATSMDDKTEPEEEDFTHAIGQVQGSTASSSHPEGHPDQDGQAPDPFGNESDEGQAIAAQLPKSPSSHSMHSDVERSITDPIEPSDGEKMEWDDEFHGVNDARSMYGDDKTNSTGLGDSHSQVWDDGMDQDMVIEYEGNSGSEDVNEGDDELDDDEMDDDEMDDDEDEEEAEDEEENGEKSVEFSAEDDIGLQDNLGTEDVRMNRAESEDDDADDDEEGFCEAGAADDRDESAQGNDQSLKVCTNFSSRRSSRLLITWIIW